MTNRAEIRAGGTAGGYPRRGRIRRFLARGTAFAAASAVAATVLPAALTAQQAEEAGAGGVRLTFGLDTRLESHTNADLDEGGGSASTELDTRLRFGYLTETRRSRLAFDASGRVRTRAGDGTSADGFLDPELGLAYTRNGAGSSFDADAFLREADLTTDGALDDFDSTEGVRRDIGGNLALRWGTDARVGYGLSASYIDSDFRDGATEPDRRRLTLGADLRLDLTEAATLTFGLSRARFDDAEDSPRDTTSLDTSLAIDRPRGALTFGLSLDDTPEGTRSGLTFGRSVRLPDGELTVNLGLTRGTSGETGVTGGLTYARELPRGQFTAEIARDITSGAEDDSERRITTANLSLTQTLSPRATLSLGLGFAESRATAGDDSVRNANADATVSYELTPDWQLNAGVSHRLRDTEAEGSARDTSVFLGLSRGFTVRY